MFIDVFSDEPDHQKFRSPSPLPGIVSPGNRMNPQNYKWAQVGKGSMFGEHEVVSRTPRETTIICGSTTGKLLRISAKDFVTVIKQISPRTIMLIK